MRNFRQKSIRTLIVLLFCSFSATAGTIYVAEESARALNAYDEATGQFRGTLISPTGPVNPIGIPYGMITTPDGHLFVADAGGHEVFVFKGNQLIQTIGIPQSDLTIDPQGVALGPDGNLVITNFNGNIISLSFANGYDSAYTNALLYSSVPAARAGVLFGPDGSLYISTSPNGSAIYKVPPGGGTAVNFAHSYLPYPFGNSRGLAWLPDGTLLVADAGWEGTGLIYKVNVSDGSMTPFITNLGGADYIAVLPADGEILVAEFSANKISKYNFQGEFLENFLTGLSQPGVLAYSEQDFNGAPEPSTWLLLLVPVGMLLLRRSRKNWLMPQPAAALWPVLLAVRPRRKHKPEGNCLPL